MAIVSIKSQQVTFYDADGWILRAPVSTGITGRETPAGVFAVIEKDKDHHSTMYDDAWMPNMQRITWNRVALHGGPLAGYAASHGCVRIPYGFAEKLFETTRIGMRVIISPNDTEPVEFSHPALFVPNREAIAAASAKAEALRREAAEAAKTADEAKKAAATAARETAPLTSSLRKLQGLKTRADAELAYADKALAAAKTDQAKARAEDLEQKAAARAADLGTQFDTVKADAKSKLDAAAAAKEAAKAAQTRKADAANAASEAKLALEPVSVYISRATQKLYVRRNTHRPAPDGGGEVFDATIEVPVIIRNPDKPLGTHVFTAQGRARSHHHPAGRVQPALRRLHCRDRRSSGIVPVVDRDHAPAQARVVARHRRGAFFCVATLNQARGRALGRSQRHVELCEQRRRNRSRTAASRLCGRRIPDPLVSRSEPECSDRHRSG
jgi:hypothetical protein